MRKGMRKVTIRTHAATDDYREGWDAIDWTGASVSKEMTTPQVARSARAKCAYGLHQVPDWRYGALSVTANDFGMCWNEACNEAATEMRETGWVCIEPGSEAVTVCRKLLPSLPANPESHVAIPLWALLALVGKP
jgi:hypothetical protein